MTEPLTRKQYDEACEKIAVARVICRRQSGSASYPSEAEVQKELSRMAMDDAQGAPVRPQTSRVEAANFLKYNGKAIPVQEKIKD